MSSVNELNAITHDRATLREQVVQLPRVELDVDSPELAPHEKGGTVQFIRLGDVLALLNGVQPASTQSVPAAYAVQRGQKVLPE